MSLPHVAFSADMNFVKYGMAAAVVGKKKRETNVTLNHSLISLRPKLFTKLFSLIFVRPQHWGV
jgi:hypothetical protein